MKALYEFVLRETSDLKNTSYALLEKPQTLKVLRLLLGIGQRDLAKLLSTSQGTIWCLEKGRTKRIPKEFLEKIFAELKKKKIKPISINELRKKERELYQKGKFHGEYAREM